MDGRPSLLSRATVRALEVREPTRRRRGEDALDQGQPSRWLLWAVTVGGRAVTAREAGTPLLPLRGDSQLQLALNLPTRFLGATLVPAIAWFGPHSLG